MHFACLGVLLILRVEALQKSRLVYPRLIEERSTDGRMVVHVHDTLTLSLREASIAAPEVRVLQEENGSPVTRLYKGEDVDRYIYEDEENLATVMVEKRDGGVVMRGLVGPRHRIQPMPVTEKSEEALVPHSIYEIEQEEMFDKTLNFAEPSREGILSERSDQYSGYVPDTVKVEVFVVSDERHHRHFRNTEQLLRYLCIAINAANLRYSAASHPKIRLILTGVEMPKTEPYAVVSQEDYLSDEGTLPKLKTYANGKKSEYGDPDLVYLMTGLDVYTVQNGRATDAGLGIGYVSGICTSFYVALGEDKPGLFTGVHTFTHEVAHLLGAKHDGDGADYTLVGHPGAKGCPWTDGHIMSYINKGPEHNQFSRCSLEQMSFVLRLRGEKCWEVSGSTYTVANKFPGMMVSFRNFCDNFVINKQRTFETAVVDEGTCKVKCRYYEYIDYEFFPGGKYKVVYDYKEDALDYMPCADEKVCIQGKCVQRPAHMPRAPESPGISPTSETSEPSTSTPTTTTSAPTTRCECDEATTAATAYPPRKSYPRLTRRMFPWRHRTRT